VDNLEALGVKAYDIKAKKSTAGQKTYAQLWINMLIKS
jgi:hypothetical protein